MPQQALPEPDERFTKLILDYFAPQHLFIAEGAGARCVIDLLSSAPAAPGRKAIYYADTVRHQTPGLVESLRAFDVKSIEVYATRLDLLRRLPGVFSQTAHPFRAYVAASTWFIQAAEEIGTKIGISRDLIMIERCEASSRKVSCAVCGALMMSQADETFQCSGCGARLQVTDYCRWRDHVHLGVPVDWPGSDLSQADATTGR